MKIFLSYASPDREVAKAIHLALVEAGHDVFFDREDLPVGEAFNARIRSAIERAHLFIFLISPEAVDAGSYTLNELALAAKTWKHPAGRLLPVLLRPIDMLTAPATLKAVTFLEADGNLTAAVVDAVQDIAKTRRQSTARTYGIFAASIAMACGLTYLLWTTLNPRSSAKDPVPTVLVPAGVFIMGDNEASPRREIYVDAFQIDAVEVTVARYAVFLEASGGVAEPDEWQTVDLSRDGEKPVVGVSWHDSEAYCAWAEKRLPTEAEWEKAARGTDERVYPWGDEPPDATRANFANYAPGAYERGLTNVGSYPDGNSPYGASDLAGNAGEWVADWYSRSFVRADVRNPEGPASGDGKVIRGGGFRDGAERVTGSWRMFAAGETRGEDLGFRCVERASA